MNAAACLSALQFQVKDPTMSVLVQRERKGNNPKCFCFFLPCISDNIVVFWRLKKNICCDVMIGYSFLLAFLFNFFFMIVLSLLFTCIVVPVVLL